MSNRLSESSLFSFVSRRFFLLALPPLMVLAPVAVEAANSGGRGAERKTVTRKSTASAKNKAKPKKAKHTQSKHSSPGNSGAGGSGSQGAITVTGAFSQVSNGLSGTFVDGGFDGGLIRVGGSTLTLDSGNGSGGFTSSAGAILGGTGIVGGGLTVTGGGTLAPGNSPGTLSVGAVNLDSNSLIRIDLGHDTGGTPDLLSTMGSLNLVQLGDVTQPADNQSSLAWASSISQSFDASREWILTDWRLADTTSALDWIGSLSVVRELRRSEWLAESEGRDPLATLEIARLPRTAIPEPSTTSMALGAAALLFRRRRVAR
jgi:hypothetical protein